MLSASRAFTKATESEFLRALPPSFWTRVEVTGFCWNWTGHRENGWGRLRFEGRHHRAHRLAYEALVGPIPEGLVIDHLCRNRGCVNPDHLEPVTVQVNVSRGFAGIWQSAKTHCPKGHRYDQENTWVNPQGKRACKTCRRQYLRSWYHSSSAPTSRRGRRGA